MKSEKISELTTARLSVYLRCLNERHEAGIKTISSQALAEQFNLNSAEIRKDLGYVGEVGVRGVGYYVDDLREHITNIRGLDSPHLVGIVGAGRLGTALANYNGFGRSNFTVVALFDNDRQNIGKRIGDERICVHDVEQLAQLIHDEAIDVMVIAVPAKAAQRVLNQIMSAGIKAVLNFAPVSLNSRKGVKVKTVDLTTSLESLSYFLAQHNGARTTHKQKRHGMDEQTARRELISVCHLMYERSYVVSSDGNVSVRLDDGRIMATPTMTCKGRMKEDLLAITDLDGRPLNDRRASSELAMHLLVYRERPEINAVCHAHPPHGTAFAVAGLAIDQPILSEVILTLGCVPLAAYGTPSTAELTEAMQPLVKHHNALLMANHGAVAYGIDLWQAWDRLETLEHTAKIAILSRVLGGSKNLPADAIEKLINVREAAGYLGESARGQACGYLREPIMENGAGKITLTREELVELLSQAVNR